MEIINRRAFAAWNQALAYIRENGYSFSDHKKRVCIECRNLLITITDPTGISAPIEWLARNPAWIYPELADIAKIMLSPKGSGSYDYNYGRRLFATRENINQIDDYVIPLLQKDNLSRRAASVLFDPGVDAKLANKEIPSIMSLVFQIRESRLHVFAHIRSSDMVLGWPANIYQLFILAEYISQKLQIPVGELSTISNSAHIYEDQKDLIKQIR